MLNVFIGYDSREPEAYEVARASILKHTTVPVHIQKLEQPALRRAGLYRREETKINGQKFDVIDGKPFSTEFSFTRFLVPALCQWQGWAVFMDCDQLFMADISILERELDPAYAVMCCQQNYLPKTEIKMDGQKQEKYFRKNWSSFMVFNCAHPANLGLTPDVVNVEPGSWLHGMKWLQDIDIGNINHGWNWIDGTTPGKPLNVHYTLGGPWFEHMRYSNAPYFEEWRQAAVELGLWEKLEQVA
jgi:hypothetical protein